MRFLKTIYAILLLSSITLLPNSSFSQIKSYPFEQLDSLQKVEKRSVAIFIHTDWCKYCQTMQNATFKNDSIIKILNEKFYFVDLNAETQKPILFNGHTFKYKPTGANTGIHELAEQLATVGNKIAYPTLCFLNSKYEIISQYTQFIHYTDLNMLLKQLY
jgi:thioredoxin-related protein